MTHPTSPFVARDWWPTLLDGLVGSILGAVVSALIAASIAIYVVRRQHQLEKDSAREVAAFEAAKTLSQAAYSALATAGDAVGRYDWSDSEKRNRAVMEWSAALALEYPALFGFIDEDDLQPITDAFDAHRERVAKAAEQMTTRNAYGERPQDQLAALNAIEAESLRKLSQIVATGHAGLDAFRRYGKDWRELAPRH